MMIEISQGLYLYGDFRLTLSLAIPAGACVAVLGPSGAGKSTFLNILAGFELLSQGTLKIGGRVMDGLPPAQFPVSMVFQDNNSFAHLDAWKNVALGISPALRLSEDDHARVDLALQRVGLKHLSHRRPGEMSGGERQRIALARVLVRDKPVLLLDEPFAALDPALRTDMLELVQQLHHEKQLTTLMVTHDVNDVRRICDHVVFVSHGVVRAPVTLSEFSILKYDPQIAAYLG